MVIELTALFKKRGDYLSKNDKNITKNQERVALALINQPSIRKASEESGISEQTIHRYLQQEHFQEHYKRVKDETIGQATARLRHGMTTAVNALIEMAENPKTPAVARAQACRSLLEYGFKAHEIEQLQERIEQLEEQMERDSA